MSSETNNLILKASQAREQSFVGRFHHDFGFENDLFDYLLDQKEMWGEKLFYVNERQFSKWVEQGKHRVREVPIVKSGTGFPPMELHETCQERFEASFGGSERIDINVTKGGHSSHHRLERGDCVSLKTAIDRNGLALNVGGYVTAMKWLHYSSGRSVLAVFVINSKDGLATVVNSPELSVFPKKPDFKGEIRSAIQIWNYDFEQSSLELSQVLDTSGLGVTSRLAWLPAKFAENVGVLSGVFTDGKLHFFEIPGNGAQTSYHDVVTPSWTVSLRAERKASAATLPITAYDFVDHDKVLVGSVDGALAEFVLPNYGETSEESNHCENESDSNEEKEKPSKENNGKETTDGNENNEGKETNGEEKTEGNENNNEGNENDGNKEENDGNKDKTEKTQDLRIPSFVTYVSDSMITSICVAEVSQSNVMLVNTATAQSFAIKYDHIRQGRVEFGFTISTLQPLYHRTYRIFVYPDSAESIGYTFARHPQQKHSLLLRTELISAFHISEYLNHPFAVVGNTCGDVYVMNIGRKIFGMPKAQNKLVVPLKIWTLFRAPGESELTLSGDYIPVTPDRNEVMCTFTPPEVVISAAAWNENFEGSSTYAFGTYSGLLVLERLDPVLI